MPATYSDNPIPSWLETELSDVGKHTLRVLEERHGIRDEVLEDLRDLIRSHYVDPSITARRMESLGASKTAALLREHYPTRKNARSGDLGEILATESAELELGYEVPVRRLRWKDGREMALRGDDILGVSHNRRGKLLILKGESKSRAALSRAVLNEAGSALDSDRGRPTRHSVLFIAERLREMGGDSLAEELEEAVLTSFKDVLVSHMLFVITARSPKRLLETHLRSAARKKRVRHALGVRIGDYADFIEQVFEGL